MKKEYQSLVSPIVRIGGRCNPTQKAAMNAADTRIAPAVKAIATRADLRQEAAAPMKSRSIAGKAKYM